VERLRRAVPFARFWFVAAALFADLRSAPPPAAIRACPGCHSGGTALLIRLAVTRLREQLADKQLRQALIAHVHNEAEQYAARRTRTATVTRLTRPVSGTGSM